MKSRMGFIPAGFKHAVEVKLYHVFYFLFVAQVKDSLRCLSSGRHEAQDYQPQGSGQDPAKQ